MESLQRPGAYSNSGRRRNFKSSTYSRKISKELNTIISVDTYKHEVAKEAVKAGADIINDIWGFAI